MVVLAPASNSIEPVTSQSPAVKLIEVIVVDTVVERETALPVAVTYSPTLPAFALLLVVVPTMPLVCEGVKLPVDERVVKEPAAAAVPPIAGGDAR